MTVPPLWLSRALCAVAALAAAGTLLPGALGGTAVMNGSARGTALVVLVVAVPALWLSSAAAQRGSVRALAVWVGASAYLTYNAVMFIFATPFNPVFPLYVAMLSLAGLSLVRTGTYAVSVRAAPLARPVTGMRRTSVSWSRSTPWCGCARSSPRSRRRSRRRSWRAPV